MNGSSRKVLRVLAITLAIIILFSAIPTGLFTALTAVKEAPLQISVISDIHYYPQSLMGSKGELWQQHCANSARQDIQCAALLDAALNAIDVHSDENSCKYLIIPGDLTKDSEYAGHIELAARLEQFEKKTGIQVLVINGNHDINNSNAITFENNREESTRAATPADFREIYKNLGYDLAYHTYSPPAGEQAGMLSYSVRLDGGYRLIAIDAGKYSGDSTADGDDEHETGGNITPGLMKWVLNEESEAASCGETVIGMMHHSFVPQFEIEPTIFQDFMVDNWLETTEALTDAGMHYAFTGHMHVSNIASHVSDNGETMYDCSTSSLTGFPNTFREVRFDNTGGGISTAYKTFDVDCEQQISAEGSTYEKPYKNTFSFGQTYGNDGLANFGAGMADVFLTSIFDDIQKHGGMLAYLTSKGIDLSGIFNNAIKGGLAVGNLDIFTSSNMMSFVTDLANQIDENYINNPAKVIEIIQWVAQGLVSMQVSDYPCTKYIDSLGFGDPEKPGTLQDAAYSVIATLYQGNEDISNDVFIPDVLDFFKNRNGAKAFYDTVIDVVLDDLIQGEILTTLDFNPGTLFPEDSVVKMIGVFLTAVIDAVFGGNNSYANIIDSTLSILPEKYNSLDGLLNYFTKDYLTQSQFDSLGCTISEIIGCMVTDEDPEIKEDNDVTLTYSGPVTFVPTVEDYRLPSQVAVTFGNNTDSTRNITWFTKYSATQTDIEIVPYSQNPVFTGISTTGAGIKGKSEKVARSTPGADLGITGFLTYDFTLVRHDIQLTGLAAGTKYSYRVGDASKGWWSQTGTIETADNSNKVTFFHMTDPQSQDELQYKTWANVVKTAYNLYPQSKFIMSTGDLTDNPANNKQWKWLLNSASTNLMSTVLMPTTGNHEEKNYSIDRNLLLPDAPQQDRSSGVYYSYDYNNVHFIVLNTNNLSSKNALSNEQIAWLKQDAAASDAQWKIVALHKAMYSNGSHYDDKDVKAIRAQLCSLLPELGIDLVLQGHDHVYLRTDVMSGNKVVKSQTKTVTYNGRDYSEKIEPKGTIYAISACSGVKYYLPKSNIKTDLLFPRAQSIVSVELPVFSAIQIDGNKLYFDAFTVNGNVTKRIDSFAVEKAPAAVNAENTPAVSNTAKNGTSASDTNTETGSSLSSTANIEIPKTGSNDYMVAFFAPIVLSASIFVFQRKKRSTGRQQ